MKIPPVFRRQQSGEVPEMWGSGRTDQQVNFSKIKHPKEKWKALYPRPPPPRASPELTLPPGKKRQLCDPFLAQVPHPNQKETNGKRKGYFLHIFPSSWNRCWRCFVGRSSQSCGDISCPALIFPWPECPSLSPSSAIITAGRTR